MSEQNPEEYESEGEGPVSGETGTVYEEAGQTETTPHDVEITEDDDE